MKYIKSFISITFNDKYYDRQENGAWFLLKYIGEENGHGCYSWIPQYGEAKNMLELEYQKMILEEV